MDREEEKKKREQERTYRWYGVERDRDVTAIRLSGWTESAKDKKKVQPRDRKVSYRLSRLGRRHSSPCFFRVAGGPFWQGVKPEIDIECRSSSGKLLLVVASRGVGREVREDPRWGEDVCKVLNIHDQERTRKTDVTVLFLRRGVEVKREFVKSGREKRW